MTTQNPLKHELHQKAYAQVAAEFTVLVSLLFLHTNTAGNSPSEVDERDLYESVISYLNTTRPVHYKVSITTPISNKKLSRNHLDVHVGAFDKESGSPRTLVKFTAPPVLKGRIFLYESGRLWVYFPNTNQPMRIPPQEQLVGSADVGSILDIDYRNLFKLESTAQKESTTAGKHSITLVSKSPNAPYGRIEFLFHEKTPVEARYYGASGKKLKTTFFDDHAISDGKPYVKKIKIIDNTNPSSKEETVITYEDIIFESIAARNFRPDYLKNMR